ncbi:MAG: multicopper oxidase family protein [Acidobacteriaceae bacterium]
MSNRRSFLQHALGWSASLFATQRLFGETQRSGPASSGADLSKHDRGHPPEHSFNTPVITPDVGDLPYTMDGVTKVFRLTAQVMKQQIAPNKTIDAWGFNGSAPGPTIQVTQGDRVRVIFENQLPEPSSIHWHGFEDHIGYDGMPGISQQPVKPGDRFVYEFDIHQEGTYFYHSHMAMQEMAGMLGAFIMHPKEPYRPHCDKDFALHFQEYAVLPNNTVPNTMNMEFNWLVINGKAGPAVTPLIIRLGDRVRIRMINLGMDHHPIHIHGHTFYVTGTEGGRIQETAWWPGNTVLVGVAQARSVEFVANNPGDWMLHCHLPHHMMNQMSSNVGRMSRMAGNNGMPAGLDMNNGMGMLNGEPGEPLGEDYGASLGRGMGFGSNADINTTNGPLSEPMNQALIEDMTQAMKQGKPQNSIRMGPMQMRNMMAMDMSKQAMSQQMNGIAPNANSVPNFPQDAYMESEMMNMEHDTMLQIPENHGLRPGWSPYMQGMMSFMRVLPPEKYDEVITRMRQANRFNDPYASILRS